MCCCTRIWGGLAVFQPVRWASSSPPRNTGPGNTRAFGLLTKLKNAALAVNRLHPPTPVCRKEGGSGQGREEKAAKAEGETEAGEEKEARAKCNSMPACLPTYLTLPYPQKWAFGLCPHFGHFHKFHHHGDLRGKHFYRVSLGGPHFRLATANENPSSSPAGPQRMTSHEHPATFLRPPLPLARSALAADSAQPIGPSCGAWFVSNNPPSWRFAAFGHCAGPTCFFDENFTFLLRLTGAPSL